VSIVSGLKPWTQPGGCATPLCGFVVMTGSFGALAKPAVVGGRNGRGWLRNR